MPNESEATTGAKNELLGYTVEGDQVVRAQPPPKEPTMAEQIDRMNSAPSKPGDYQLPEFRLDSGEVWQPTPQEAAAINNLKALAHAAGLPNFQFNAVAEIVSRPNYVRLSPEAAMGHLKVEWGGQFERNARVVAEVLDRVEAKHPGAQRFLQQSGLGNSIDLIKALYAAGSRRR